jgi:hypothetical protein
MDRTNLMLSFPFREVMNEKILNECACCGQGGQEAFGIATSSSVGEKGALF